jgi:hypothetical protein
VKAKNQLIFLILLCLGTFGFTYSANGDKNKKVLCGKVIDNSTGESLAGIKIQVKGTDTYCYSDLDGKYVLTVSSDVKPEILIQGTGYQQTSYKSEDLGFNVTIDLAPLR